jgi:hypothetical protein
MDNEYIKQLEEANQKLQDRVEELETKLDWREETKDWRAIAETLHTDGWRMGAWNRYGELVTNDKACKMIDGVLSLSGDTINDMWVAGYRINTFSEQVDDGHLFSRRKNGFSIVNKESSKYPPFAMSIYVSKSFFPWISNKCYILMAHNEICEFTGSMSQSFNRIDSCLDKRIMNMVKLIETCKVSMNGRLLKMAADKWYPSDKFLSPWADVPENKY